MNSNSFLPQSEEKKERKRKKGRTSHLPHACPLPPTPPPLAAPTPQAALQAWSSGQRSSQVEVLLYHNPFQHLSRTRHDGDPVPSRGHRHPRRKVYPSFRRESREGEAGVVEGRREWRPFPEPSQVTLHRSGSPSLRPVSPLPLSRHHAKPVPSVTRCSPSRESFPQASCLGFSESRPRT